jgi:HSP20 family protein
MKMNSWRSEDGKIHPLATLRRGMDEIFSRLFNNGTDLADSAWNPSLEVSDGAREVTVRAEIPGVDAENIEVTVSNGYLTISGEKKSEHEEKEKDYYRSERVFGSFRRSIQLPDGADPEKITADHSNGILTVRIPKAESAQPKKVAVSRK